MGEAGSEHLLTSCAAAHQAWTALDPRSRLLIDAAMAPRNDDRLLAQFLHQLSFLHCALLTKTHWPGPKSA
eukprot:7611174-Prorocentrum_lima.AAC.1